MEKIKGSEKLPFIFLDNDKLFFPGLAEGTFFICLQSLCIRSNLSQFANLLSTMNLQIVNLKFKEFYLFLAFAFIYPIKQSYAEIKKYYIDTEKGNDQNNGTSPQKAFQSIARLNSLHLIGGEQLLFKGGQQFYGSLKLTRVHFGSEPAILQHDS